MGPESFHSDRHEAKSALKNLVNSPETGNFLSFLSATHNY